MVGPRNEEMRKRGGKDEPKKEEKRMIQSPSLIPCSPLEQDLTDK